MLRTRKTDGGSIARVEGAAGEMMLFYLTWQTFLWEGFLKKADFKDPESRPLREIKSVIERVNDGNELVLSDNGSLFEHAYTHAVGVCRSVGIEVEEE